MQSILENVIPKETSGLLATNWVGPGNLPEKKQKQAGLLKISLIQSEKAFFFLSACPAPNQFCFYQFCFTDTGTRGRGHGFLIFTRFCLRERFSMIQPSQRTSNHRFTPNQLKRPQQSLEQEQHIFICPNLPPP